MRSKSRIVVLKMKELTYAAIFIALAIVMVILMICMFSSKDDETTSKYTSGIYTAPVKLLGEEVEVSLLIDEDQIKSISFVSFSEDIEASFPLAKQSLETMANQIIKTQSLENITVSEDMKYTSGYLFSAIEEALNLAKKE